MNRVWLNALACTAAAVIIAARPQGAQGAQPNIVFMLADDCTRFDLGCYGSTDSKTPAIDRLAAEGMRFTRCFQASPMCSPTRHNLMTGVYPTRSGAYPNHTFADSGMQSVVQRLKPLGYRVALAGKRHIGPESVFPFEYLDNDTGDGEGKGPVFSAVDAFIADAVAQKTPFCLFLCSHLPHSPWNKGNQAQFNENTLTLPPHFVDNPATRRNYRNYLAEINALDTELQSALGLLDKHNIAGKTAVFFASEQGTSMPFAKWTCYNAGLGSAMIVRWPGIVASGSVSAALIDYADVLPTFIDMAGGQPVSGLDGTSFMPVLTAQRMAHKSFSCGLQTTRGIFGGCEYFPIRSITDARYRLILNPAPEVTFACKAEMPDWITLAATDPVAAGLVDRFKHRPAVELYDDIRDKWNLTNLADSVAYDSIKSALYRQLGEWMQHAGDDPLEAELSAFDRMTNKRPHNGDSVVVIQTIHPSSSLQDTSRGVRYALFNLTADSLPDISMLTPAGSGTVANFTTPAALPGRTGAHYAVRYTAMVRAQTRGFHTFYLNSCNQTRLSINGSFIVGTSRTGGSGPLARRYGCIALDTGWHAIEVTFLGTDAGDTLSVTWSYPGLIAAEGNLGIPNRALACGDMIVASRAHPAAAISSTHWIFRDHILHLPPALSDGEIRVFNARGSRLTGVRSSSRINLATLPPGVYLVQACRNGTVVATGRILKR